MREREREREKMEESRKKRKKKNENIVREKRVEIRLKTKCYVCLWHVFIIFHNIILLIYIYIYIYRTIRYNITTSSITTITITTTSITAATVEYTEILENNVYITDFLISHKYSLLFSFHSNRMSLNNNQKHSSVLVPAIIHDDDIMVIYHRTRIPHRPIS